MNRFIWSKVLKHV